MAKHHDLSAAQRIDAIARILAEGVHRWMRQRSSAQTVQTDQPPARPPGSPPDRPGEPGR